MRLAPSPIARAYASKCPADFAPRLKCYDYRRPTSLQSSSALMSEVVCSGTPRPRLIRPAARHRLTGCSVGQVKNGVSDAMTSCSAVAPSSDSRMMSAWPTWRAVSSMTWESTHRTERISPTGICGFR